MNLVEQIVDSLNGELQIVLGADHNRLEYIYDVSKNSFTNNSKRYGVEVMSASSAATVTRAFTLDHIFKVIVTDNYFNKEESDLDQRKVIFALYDKIDEITKRIYAKKIGLPSIVLFVSLDNIEEPEFIDEDNVAVLKAIYTIKYRNLID